MRFFEMIRLVLKNLLENKSKVILTSLGIIAGTATIVAVIAIGKGGEEAVKDQFSGLSAETIYVNVDYSKGNKVFEGSYPHLTTEQMEFIMNESTTLSGIYLRGGAYKQAVLNGIKGNVSITGVTEEYSTVSKLNIIQGYNIDRIDIEEGNHVVVIGDGIATKYFSQAEEAVGKTITIEGKNYKIIGVLERSADGMQGLSPDDTIFMPYSIAQENIFDKSTTPQIVALANNIKSVKKAMAEIEDSLNYLLEDDNVYKAEDAGSRIEAASESARTMNVLLISVASIVFVVGGIGIMNVLSLTVKELTPSSPLRSSFMSLFLFEAIIISSFGGITGILVSYCVIPLVRQVGVAVSPSVEGQIMALGFAIFTGTIFGFSPAYKASQLKPVEALSYE